MTTLNAMASEAMLAAGAHAATDVTGFGLLGHANEMARASGVALRIAAPRVPRYSLALELLAAGISPAGSRANAEQHARFTTFSNAVSGDVRIFLSDAQTSGGLLIALAPENVDALLGRLGESTGLGAVIGAVEAGAGINVTA